VTCYKNLTRYSILFTLLILTSCSPWKSDTISDSQILQLERSVAIQEWKQSQLLTDECSSPQPIHWLASTFLDRNWSDCCYQHDFDYHYGYQYGITENKANYALWSCVADSGHPFVANLIYDAVKLFGWKYYQTVTL
jgi:hypothetical protein